MKIIISILGQSIINLIMMMPVEIVIMQHRYADVPDSGLIVWNSDGKYYTERIGIIYSIYS